MEIRTEKCDVCGAELHWSSLVEGLPQMSTVSDCRHVVQIGEPTDVELLQAQVQRLKEALEKYRTTNHKHDSCVKCIGPDCLEDHRCDLCKQADAALSGE